MKTFTVDHNASRWTVTENGSVMRSGPVNPRTIDHLIVLIKRAGLTVITVGKKKKGKRIQTMSSQPLFNEVDARHYDALLKISRDDVRVHGNTIRTLIRNGLLEADGVTITGAGHTFMQQYKNARADDAQEFTLSADGSPILPSTNGNSNGAHPDLSGEIATLRRQVSDLSAQNEHLSDQVAKLRHVVTRLLRRHIDDDLAAALDLILQD